MVKSQIKPNEVTYLENRDIDDEDIDYSASVYSYDIFNTPIEIALGKEKYTYMKHDIVYYPLYLIVDEAPVAKIGVFELDTHMVLKVQDEEGDIDLSKGKLVVFSFVTKEYLSKIENKESEVIDKIIDNGIKEKVEIEEDITTIKIPTQTISREEERIQDKLKQGIFKKDPNMKTPITLQEESKTDAEEIKKEFKESKRNQWIANCLKNNYYDIIDNEGAGDCFFAVIRDAFEQIGQITTVDKLRALLAEEATPEIFENYRELYVNFLGEVQAKDAEMKNVKKTGTELKKRKDMTLNRDESKQIVEQAKQIVTTYNKLKGEKEDIEEMLKEFVFMEGIDSIEKFREVLQTQKYWADTWAISTLEKKLNIKVILLDKQSYTSNDLDSVLNCGQLNDADLEKQGRFAPDYYIMTSYLGWHYQLITYKNKRIFKFGEIPYDIKALVINKCMERNAGPYYLIREFRTLKRQMGLPADTGSPHGDNEDEDNITKDLYDTEIVFSYHSSSSSQPKAGAGLHESIPKMKMMDFNMLNKNKECFDWRKRLDDSWISPFELDGQRWASVEHFLLGSRYKKGFPDFYSKFAMNSESNISKDVVMARAAVGESGKYKDEILRARAIKQDADYKETPEERMRALDAKFNQNLDLKMLLKATMLAKLHHFKRGQEPIIDVSMMTVRKNLT
jgi:hypothetical protein